MSKAEIQFLVSFVAGMAVFFLSGQAAAHLPIMPSQLLAQVVGTIVSGGLYGLGAAMLAWFTLGADRSVKAVLIAAAVAIVLAELTAQFLLRAIAGYFHGTTGLTMLMFVMYLLFGLYYVFAGLIARRFAK